MAWSGQCKMAFKVNADALLHKRGGKGVSKVLRQLSKESGIPYLTLKRWYYNEEKSSSKNDTAAHSDEPILCEVCQIRQAERKRKSDGSWKYYSMCSSCRRAKKQIRIQCPHCEKFILIKRGEIL